MTNETNYVETRNKLSQGYDGIAYAIGSMPSYFLPAAARFIGAVDGCRVLDLGCGNGHLLRQVVNSNPQARAVGLDFSRALLANAQAQAPSSSFCRGDLNTSLPFADASCDVVLLSEVYEHLLQPRPLLGEIRRILKPAGVFIMTFPNADGYSLYRLFGQALVAAAKRVKPLLNWIPYEHPLRTEQPIDALLHYGEMIKTVQAAGFRVDEIQGQEIFPELFALKGMRHLDYFHSGVRTWMSHMAVRIGQGQLCYRVFLRCKVI